jgi:hypothetical protein
MMVCMYLSATGLCWVGWTEPFNVVFDVARRKIVRCCPDLLVMTFHLIIIRSASPAQVQQQRNDVSVCCCIIDGSSGVAASVVHVSASSMVPTSAWGISYITFK